MAKVVLKDIKKAYENGFVAVHNFNLEIEDKEFINTVKKRFFYDSQEWLNLVEFIRKHYLNQSSTSIGPLNIFKELEKFEIGV